MSDSTNSTGETTTASPTDSIPAGGKDVLQSLEEGVATLGRETWKFFHDLPGHGAVLGGAVGLAGAMLVGVAELVTAGFTAYVTYRVFAYGESWTEAIEKTIKFEKGTLPEDEIAKPVPD